MIIKRSFRRYFFRRYKKQLRRIMNCWRSYWLRHHLKLIQRVYRGVLGRRLSRVTRLKVIANEAVRGARELETVNEMLVIVEDEFRRHQESKDGRKEVRDRAKVSLRVDRRRAGKSLSRITSEPRLYLCT